MPVVSLTLLFAALAAFALSASPGARAADAPPRDDTPLPLPITITLQHARAQTLPAEVRDVWFGPDDRPWFEITTATQPAVEVVQKIIEREWSQPTPQIIGARIALFEAMPTGLPASRPVADPPGRIWFITRDNRTLLGYDGRTWIVHPSDNPLLGEAPNHGGAGSRSYNLLLAGQCFFPDQGGVHHFDGKAWSYQRLGAGTGRGPLTLVPDPGRGVYAYYRVLGQGNIYRWRDGAWSTLANSQTLGAGTGTILSLAATDRALYWVVLRTLNVLPIAPAAATRPAPDVFDALVKQLGADDFEARQQATDALVKFGDPARRQVEEAMRNASDPEVKTRLELVRDRITGRLQRGPARFGALQIDACQRVQPGPDGAVIICSNIIENGAASQGVLVARGDSAWHVKDLPTAGADVLATGRDRFWVPTTAGPALIDRAGVQRRIDDATLLIPLTTRPDGVLIIATRVAPTPNARNAGPPARPTLVMIDPSAPASH